MLKLYMNSSQPLHLPPEACQKLAAQCDLADTHICHFLLGDGPRKKTSRKKPGLVIQYRGYLHTVPKKQILKFKVACLKALDEDVEFVIGIRILSAKATGCTVISPFRNEEAP